MLSVHYVSNLWQPGNQWISKKTGRKLGIAQNGSPTLPALLQEAFLGTPNNPTIEKFNLQLFIAFGKHFLYFPILSCHLVFFYLLLSVYVCVSIRKVHIITTWQTTPANAEWASILLLTHTTHHHQQFDICIT